jgi:hypothetical protein
MNSSRRRTTSNAVAILSTWLYQALLGRVGRRSASKPALVHIPTTIKSGERPTQAYRIEPVAGRYHIRLTTIPGGPVCVYEDPQRSRKGGSCDARQPVSPNFNGISGIKRKRRKSSFLRMPCRSQGAMRYSQFEDLRSTHQPACACTQATDAN